MKVVNATGRDLPGSVEAYARKLISIARLAGRRPFKKSGAVAQDPAADVYVVVVTLGLNEMQDYAVVVDGVQFKITQAYNDGTGVPQLRWSGGQPPFRARIGYKDSGGVIQTSLFDGHIVNVDYALIDPTNGLQTSSRALAIAKHVNADGWWADDLRGGAQQDEIGIFLEDSAGRSLFAPFCPASGDPLHALYTQYGPDLSCTPPLVWANPPSLLKGFALTDRILNAVAHVPGTSSPLAGAFAYSPAVGTVMNTLGSNTLSTVFTATDTVHYLPASKSVTIQVIPRSVIPSFTAVWTSAVEGLRLRGDKLTLHDTSTSPDGKSYTIAWTIPGADSSTYALFPYTEAGSTSLFYPLGAGIFTISMTATDSDGLQSTATIVVNVDAGFVLIEADLSYIRWRGGVPPYTLQGYGGYILPGGPRVTSNSSILVTYGTSIFDGSCTPDGGGLALSDSTGLTILIPFTGAYWEPPPCSVPLGAITNGPSADYIQWTGGTPPFRIDQSGTFYGTNYDGSITYSRNFYLPLSAFTCTVDGFIRVIDSSSPLQFGTITLAAHGVPTCSGGVSAPLTAAIISQSRVVISGGHQLSGGGYSIAVYPALSTGGLSFTIIDQYTFDVNIYGSCRCPTSGVMVTDADGTQVYVPFSSSYGPTTLCTKGCPGSSGGGATGTGNGFVGTWNIRGDSGYIDEFGSRVYINGTMTLNSDGSGYSRFNRPIGGGSIQVVSTPLHWVYASGSTFGDSVHANVLVMQEDVGGDYYPFIYYCGDADPASVTVYGGWYVNPDYMNSNSVPFVMTRG